MNKAITNKDENVPIDLFGSIQFNVPFMNSVMSMAWEEFTIQSGDVIRDSFWKTRLCPLAPPTSDNNVSSL